MCELRNEKSAGRTVFYDSDATGNDPVIYVNGVATAITEQSTPTGTRDSDAAELVGSAEP